jgi:GH15 family glucan-1,4-alpha-glucosidase
LHLARQAGLAPDENAWRVECEMLKFLESEWRHPDEGIWEIRGPRRHFTHSKVMAWVAMDRAVASVEEFGFRGDVQKWRAARDEIHAEVCAKGFDPRLNSFVQHYGSDEPDASLLMLPLVGFLPATDPRIAGTVSYIEKRLVHNGLVSRYCTDSNVDGLPAELRNDVGLLSEEYDIERERLIGNFPQAFSHIGLINSARSLSRMRGAAAANIRL